MIRREDFQIDISQSPEGATVHVRHLLTGKEQIENGIQQGDVGRVRDRLVRMLEAELYDENEFEIRIGCAECGDFLQVIHFPSGKSRSIHPIGNKEQHLLIREMTDSILEELFQEAKKDATNSKR
jgi:hypothetical protein